MPELKLRGYLFSSQCGSAMTTVLPLTIVVAIGIAGFLGMARNSINQEIKELNNDKAFLAAETGLLLGSQLVLSRYDPNTFFSQSDIFGQSLRGTDAVNGMDVTVNIDVNGPAVTVTSTAENTTLLNYKKQISRKMNMVVGNMPSGKYGLYLDNAFVLGGNTNGIRKMDWDGPVHFNTALQLGNPGKGNETHFNSRVSLFNINPLTNLSVYDASHGTGHFGNDYRFGVEGGTGNWDAEFMSLYDPLANKVVTDLNTTGKVDLTLNANDSNLTFGATNGNPWYKYKRQNGTDTSVNYDSTSEIMLHIVNKGVAVSGSVGGKISLYTDAGKDIYLPGNLTYSDFQTSAFSNADKPTNHGYGLSSSKILGLYSGGNFVVSEGDHYISGQFFAVNSSTSALRFLDDQKNRTKLYLFGTLAVSGFWDSPQGNNQATFQQVWDRRSLFAPGLSLRKVDRVGNTVVTSTCTYSDWNELNLP